MKKFPKTIYVTVEGEKEEEFFVVNNSIEEGVGINGGMVGIYELKEFVEYLQGGPRPRCNLSNAEEVTKAILGLKGKAY